MKIQLVCYENTDSWILGKITTCLAEALRGQGVAVEIGKTPDADADINYHIIYDGWNGSSGSGDTAMITHIDTAEKVSRLKRQLAVAEMGICLSADTMFKLAALGVPRNKLSFINFPSPQQGEIQPRKLHVGIASRCYEAGNKRENLLAQLALFLEPEAFTFHIMGQGWDAVIHELRQYGIDVVYYSEFDQEVYRRLWQKLDYYLYLGQDEGSTGYLDAMEAGVPVIATPQGFHLDLPEGLTHPFNDFEDLVQIFSELAGERQRRQKAVAALSWSEYARKHLIVWREVLNRRAGRTLYPVTQAELESVGLSAEAATGPSGGIPWLAGMPRSSGPGGAAHRPRLLLVADESLDNVEDVWRTIVAPRDLAIFLNRAGSPSERRRFPQQGLEIKLLDYRSYSDKEIVALSFDFDAVGFWNIAPPCLLKRLQRRSKMNYYVPGNRRFFKIGERLQGRLSRNLFFKLVNNLRMRSRAVTVSFWTRSLRESKAATCEFLSGVDAVFFTGPECETDLRPIARSICCMPPPGEDASWEPVFKLLFKTMKESPAKESGSFTVRLFKALGSLSYRFLPRPKIGDGPMKETP